MNDTPVFKFALREDVQDDLRFLPTKGEPLATGWDVRACQPDRKDIVLRAGQYAKIPLGFKTFCPDGWWYQLHPRSSSFAKKSLHSLIGVADESYEGQLFLACQYIPDISSLGNDLIISFGDAIAQIIPVRRQEMTVEAVTNEHYEAICMMRGGVRGAGGFGSTGK